MAASASDGQDETIESDPAALLAAVAIADLRYHFDRLGETHRDHPRLAEYLAYTDERLRWASQMVETGQPAAAQQLARQLARSLERWIATAERTAEARRLSRGRSQRSGFRLAQLDRVAA